MCEMMSHRMQEKVNEIRDRPQRSAFPGPLLVVFKKTSKIDIFFHETPSEPHAVGKLQLVVKAVLSEPRDDTLFVQTDIEALVLLLENVNRPLVLLAIRKSLQSNGHFQIFYGR